MLEKFDARSKGFIIPLLEEKLGTLVAVSKARQERQDQPSVVNKSQIAHHLQWAVGFKGAELTLGLLATKGVLSLEMGTARQRGSKSGCSKLVKMKPTVVFFLRPEQTTQPCTYLF